MGDTSALQGAHGQPGLRHAILDEEDFHRSADGVGLHEVVR
jgi:hypothetical protein